MRCQKQHNNIRLYAFQIKLMIQSEADTRRHQYHQPIPLEIWNIM